MLELDELKKIGINKKKRKKRKSFKHLSFIDREKRLSNIYI